MSESLIRKLELPFLKETSPFYKNSSIKPPVLENEDLPIGVENKTSEEKEKEELEAFKNNIYDQAYLKGKEEGRAEALQLLQKDFEDKLTEKEKSIEEKLASVMEKLIHELQHITHYLVGLRQSQEKDTLELTRLLVSKLVAHLMPHTALHHVENMIIECFHNLYGDTSLVIYVHPDMVSPLQEKTEALAGSHHFNGEYHIKAKEGLELIDCEIVWQHGKLESSLKERWDKIDNLMNESLSVLSFSQDTVETVQIDLANKENKDTLQAV